jgi:hypothetical protein
LHTYYNTRTQEIFPMILNILFYLCHIIANAIFLLLVIAFCLSTVGIMSKPNYDTFINTVKFNVKHNDTRLYIKNANIFEKFIKNKSIDSLISNATYTMIDYGVCRLAHLYIENDIVTFVGMLNHWYQL